MIRIKQKFIPPQPRNKKYSSGATSGGVSIVGGAVTPSTSGIVALAYSEDEYNVD